MSLTPSPAPGPQAPGRFSLAWVVLTWRLVCCPATALFQDWLVYAAIAWIINESPALGQDIKARIRVAIMALLFGIYVQGQAGHVLRVLGQAP